MLSRFAIQRSCSGRDWRFQPTRVGMVGGLVYAGKVYLSDSVYLVICLAGGQGSVEGCICGINLSLEPVCQIGNQMKTAASQSACERMMAEKRSGKKR